MFDNDIDVLDDFSGKYTGFVKALHNLIEVMARLVSAPPLYKLYNNKLSQDFVENSKV